MAYCSPYNDAYADEDTVKRLYLLILKKQYGMATEEDIEELRELAFQYLCFAYRTLRNWLACHGHFDYDDFFECWFEDGETCVGTGEGFIERLKEALNKLSYCCGDPSALNEIVWNIEILGIYYTVRDVLHDGVEKLYGAYKENIVYLDAYPKIVKTYEELKKWANSPFEYPLKDLILLVDRVTDTEHSAGNLLWDWGGIDVQEAKEEAEKEFEELLGGGKVD